MRGCGKGTESERKRGGRQQAGSSHRTRVTLLVCGTLHPNDWALVSFWILSTISNENILDIMQQIIIIIKCIPLWATWSTARYNKRLSHSSNCTERTRHPVPLLLVGNNHITMTTQQKKEGEKNPGKNRSVMILTDPSARLKKAGQKISQQHSKSKQL